MKKMKKMTSVKNKIFFLWQSYMKKYLMFFWKLVFRKISRRHRRNKFITAVRKRKRGLWMKKMKNFLFWFRSGIRIHFYFVYDVYFTRKFLWRKFLFKLNLPKICFFKFFKFWCSCKWIKLLLFVMKYYLH